MGTGQEDRRGPFHCHSHPLTSDTTLPCARPLCRRAQSPDVAMSGPGSPTLAPAQLCSWPPPAAPVAGPKARAGTTDITIQLKLDLEPEAGGGLWGQGWRARE